MPTEMFKLQMDILTFKVLWPTISLSKDVEPYLLVNVTTSDEWIFDFSFRYNIISQL